MATFNTSSTNPFGFEKTNYTSSYSAGKQQKNIASIFIIAIISGFLGGLLSLAFYTSQNKNLHISGVSTGTTTLKVNESSDLTKVVKKILPSVVSIISVKNVQGFFGSTTQETGGGTGFIVTSDGLILTNKHVVDDNTANYHVFLNDGTSYAAKVQSIDPIMDLALIKINAKNLKVATLGDSSNLQIGQRVIAVGNALGEFQNTVTSGIISALERSIQASDSLGNQTERLDGLLQTDAAINPGNSGGPLVNLAGQVIGINTAVASLSQSQGISFAIPINFAKTALKSYEKYRTIVRAYLGVRFVQITPEIAKANNLVADRGALIYAENGQVAVVPGSPAAKAGLKAGDIITAVNKEKITNSKGLVLILQQFMPGDTVTVTYLRDKDTKSVKVILGELKS